MFADQALLAELPRAARPQPWTARVGVGNEASLAAAEPGRDAHAGCCSALARSRRIVGLAFTVRAARAAADLTAVQSEFVSAVSHEMKTPLSLIKLASDTLANGRFATPAAVADYGRMINVEAQHLTRLIDNVLCYARISDGTSPYDFEPIDIVESCRSRSTVSGRGSPSAGIEVQLQLPPDPALVRADHLMLLHVVRQPRRERGHPCRRGQVAGRDA